MPNTRVDKLRQDMQSAGLDALLITDEKNMHYYSGFYHGEGYLLIKKDLLFVVTDFRYTETASVSCQGYTVKNIADFNIHDYVSDEETCGFEDLSVSYNRYKTFSQKLKKLIPVHAMTNQNREVKDKDEIACMRKAAEIADVAFSQICSKIRIGMTEREIAAELEYSIKTGGADGMSFDTIVASGARGSMPHATVSDKKICSGELVVMDFGCIYKGYCSDMTRTIGIGTISDELKKVYDTVYAAQLAALERVCPQVSGAFLHNTARAIIDREYPGTFGHALGHSVGLAIHESPNLSPKNMKLLSCGNAVTVEPGIYIPGKCGVRIEDLVIVTENGCDILSKSTKKLLLLG